MYRFHNRLTLEGELASHYNSQKLHSLSNAFAAPEFIFMIFRLIKVLYSKNDELV